MKQIYIIEHLEPEVFPWCVIEYKHISQTVGKENLWFTNLKDKKGAEALEHYGKCMQESVKNIELPNACILDPAVEETLEPHENSKFNYLVFGGILGDYPPKQRTKIELTPLLPKAVVRNIGKEQMSTDNAVLVVSEIMSGLKLADLKFQDGIEVEINEVESVQLPYRYCIIKGKPFISPELVQYLKEKETF